jgi:ArsR family transcriptional regulator
MSLTDSELNAMLRALADPSRRKILRVLHNSPAKGLCASEIEQKLGLSQSTISHHMSVLTAAGLVEPRKDGLWVWYRRNQPAMGKLAKSLGKNL